LVARIIGVCGPGLAFEAQTNRVVNSLVVVLDPWLTEFDLELDILPAVAYKTEKERPPGKALADFALLTDNIRKHRRQRLGGPVGKPAVKAADETSRGVASAVPSMADDARRELLIRGHRVMICAMEEGGQPRHVLTAEERALPYDAEPSAFARALARYRQELEELVAQSEGRTK
jgi:hypothetical protein